MQSQNSPDEERSSTPEPKRRKQNSDKASGNESGGTFGSFGSFSHELRLWKNSCPLCSFVQKEIEKGNSFPVEEWIYLAHLRNAHGIEP